jgi:GDP-D-mannose dehydratase
MINKNSFIEYNVCGKDVHKMQYFADLLIEASKLKDIVQKIHQPFYRPIDIQLQIGDTTRLLQDTSWKQEISIEQTMNNLLNYWIEKLGK